MSKATDSTDTAQLMAERYGVGSPRKRRVAIGVVALCAMALTGWLGWAAWDSATGTVAGTVDSFDVVSAHRVDVTVDIHRPADSPAQCLVQAQASDLSIVGESVVSVPTGGASDVQVQQTIKTDHEAASVLVSGCR